MKVKVWHILIVILILIALVFVCWYFLIYQKLNKHGTCLGEDEMVEYALDPLAAPNLRLPSHPTTTIVIKDTKNVKETFHFVINNIDSSVGALEVHKCGVYVIRGEDFDSYEGYYRKKAFWRYKYDGSVDLIISSDEFKNYSPIFRINSSETMISLNRQLVNDLPPDAVVIREIKAEGPKNIKIVSVSNLLQEETDLVEPRDIGVSGWSSDGRYLWGGSSSQIDVVYFRIDVNNDDIEIFSMPSDATHHGPPNFNTGYIAYTYGPPWVGIEEDAQKIYDEWARQGNKNTLFLYNLFTKEKKMIFSTEDSAWNFKERWLSDTELEYYLPDGERKIYLIK